MCHQGQIRATNPRAAPAIPKHPDQLPPASSSNTSPDHEANPKAKLKDPFLRRGETQTIKRRHHPRTRMKSACSNIYTPLAPSQPRSMSTRRCSLWAFKWLHTSSAAAVRDA